MRGVFEFPEALQPVQRAIDDALSRVEQRFDRQLASELPPVQQLVTHVERYRGKMLRPTVAVLAGLACDRRAEGAFGSVDEALLASDDLVTVGAVCEMVHMATLVHDDILDEADVRRRGETVNKLRGNEAAVLLGDYLIAGSFELCSQLEDQAVALAIGRMSMELCAGELLQNHNRDSYSLDEATYYEIVSRKTGALIAEACRLGALQTEQPIEGTDLAELAEGFGQFGSRLGIAFQIQDDLLDLLGEQRTVGKSVNKDLEKGKMTLPMIHHLARVGPAERGRSLTLLEQSAGVLDSEGAETTRAKLQAALRETGSVEFAEQEAVRLVDEAKEAIRAVPESLPKLVLMLMSDAVVSRSF